MNLEQAAAVDSSFLDGNSPSDLLVPSEKATVLLERNLHWSEWGSSTLRVDILEAHFFLNVSFDLDASDQRQLLIPLRPVFASN